MKTFAQILSGRAHWIFDSEAQPEFAADIVMVEITGTSPMPKEGWAWDDASATFLAPPGPTLSELRAAKIAEINAACQSAIYLGFESSALGGPHAYPAKTIDQQNLSASVLASLMPGLATNWTTPFWCADVGGAWDFRSHTAAQIQQAGQDGKTAILAALGKNKTLADQVAAAATADQVAAIVW